MTKPPQFLILCPRRQLWQRRPENFARSNYHNQTAVRPFHVFNSLNVLSLRTSNFFTPPMLIETTMRRLLHCVLMPTGHCCPWLSESFCPILMLSAEPLAR